LVEHNGRRQPFGAASSWTNDREFNPATAAPTAIDDTEIGTTATVSRQRFRQRLNINADVTVSGC
jgi:hypothetical protein